jgi:glycosyltransferase involved in cell wall biosynthesis
MTDHPLVSVIVPTYHRPEMMRAAVTSVLGQELTEGSLEVIVAVSDRDSSTDRRAADDLAATDPRVRVVVAGRLGPGAARNAAMSVARGSIFAFTDDDCEASPGWVQAGVDALRSVDIVQGRTVLTEPRSTRMMRGISVDGISHLWQTCNLFVRRSAVDKVGGFDEEWNPTGRPGGHWGEDTEWGSRLVRSGATYVFAPNAEVRHAVTARSLSGLLTHKLNLRFFPMLIRRAPETRRHLYAKYFLNRQHATLTASLGLVAGASVAAALGSTPLAIVGFVTGGIAALWPIQRSPVATLVSTANELVSYAVVVYGSVRYRRLVL